MKDSDAAEGMPFGPCSSCCQSRFDAKLDSDMFMGQACFPDYQKPISATVHKIDTKKDYLIY